MNNSLFELEQELLRAKQTTAAFGADAANDIPTRYSSLFALEEQVAGVKQFSQQRAVGQISVAKTLITQPAVYLPWADEELTHVAQDAIYALPNMHPHILTGKAKPLAQLSPLAKLYMIVHGHATMPRFVVKGDADGSKKGVFTAAEMAHWMENDGFKKDHRDLEMLVCHAGESVGTAERVKKRLAIVEKWQKIQASSLSAAAKAEHKKQLDQEFMALHQDPTAFISGDQVLPMSAQLIQAFKDRGYTNIRVISYAGSVPQSFGKNNPYDYPPTYGDDMVKKLQWGQGQVWVTVNGKAVPGKDHQKIWL